MIESWFFLDQTLNKYFI